MNGPLEGYRVIELASYVAGPGSTRLLADWGAEVIKLESFMGDEYRTNAPIYKMPTESDLENPCFDVVAVNKRFLAMDLRTEEGKRIFDELLAGADVLMTNTRQASLERLGYDWDTVKERFPHLVYAHMSGYGDKGAERNTPGYDYTCYAARGGVTGSLYERGESPMVPGPAFGDLQASVCLAAGILAALLQRERTGRGDRVTVSLHGTAVYMMHLIHSAAQYGYLLPASRKEAMNPFNNTYRTADDKWMQLAVADFNGRYNHIMKTLGRPDLVDDPRYSNISHLREAGYHREYIEILEEAIARHTLDEWAQIFKEADVAFEPLRTSLDVLEDPEVWANDFARKITYPTGNERIVFNNPIHIDSLGVPPFNPSRGIGADTIDVLSELGRSDEEIKDLIAKGVVVQSDEAR